jgi:DNA-binding Xre family transcriptional regulator
LKIDVNQFKYLMEKNLYTYQKLSDDSGLGMSTLFKIIREPEKDVAISTVKKLCKTFKVKPEVLVSNQMRFR